MKVLPDEGNPYPCRESFGGLGGLFQKSPKIASCVPAVLNRHVCLDFAVDATVDLVGGLSQAEDVGQLLLGGGDATGVLTFENVLDLQGEGQLLLFHADAVLDHVDGDAGADECQGVEVGVDRSKLELCDLGRLEWSLADHW